MQKTCSASHLPRATLLAIFLTGAGPLAHAQTPENSIQLGVGTVDFHVRSHDMTGPAGTTPAGAQADVKSKTVWPLIFDHRISGPWSITFQGGLPPVLTLKGAGSAAALGDIATVRAWFPALMGTYTWEANQTFALHAGAGLHYTFFTDAKPNATYNNAFGGTSSDAQLSASLGPIAKLGATWSLDRNWFLDFSVSKYWIRTTATINTATPGVGEIERKMKVRTSPQVLSMTVGYRF